MRFLILAVIMVSGCVTGLATYDIPQEEHFNYTIRFCGDCINPLLQMINSSEEVKCALYSADESVLQSLQRKNAAVVIDKNAKTYGTAAIKRSNSGLMHNKFCVFDKTIVWTGSFNPTGNRNSDDVIVINSTILASNYLDEFNELKTASGMRTTTTRILLNNTLIENYFCPEDNCINILQQKIAEANSSIYFATYSFTHPKIANELVIKHSEGIRVSGIAINSSYSQLQPLRENSIAVASKRIHHKFWIIDNKIVITGSFNPTRNGDERNDENMLIIHSKKVAEAYAAYFHQITL